MIRLIAAPPDVVLAGGTIDAQKGYPTADDTPEGLAHLTAHQSLSEVPLTIYRVRRDTTWWVIVPDGTTLLTSLPGDATNPPRRAIIARPTPGLDDWYRIEWEEHDGRSWEEHARELMTWGGHCNVTYHCLSARLEPYTCVEGTRDQMEQIAEAVLASVEVQFKRCAVAPHGEHFAFWSPRNSNGRIAVVHGEDARGWAATFLRRGKP